MIVSELIEKLKFIQQHYGDLQVFDSNLYADVFVLVRESEDFDEDLDLPEKFVIVGDDA